MRDVLQVVVMFVVVCPCVLIAFSRFADASPRGLAAPKNLRCEYLVNPLGLDVRAPRFSRERRPRRQGNSPTF